MKTTTSTPITREAMLARAIKEAKTSKAWISFVYAPIENAEQESPWVYCPRHAISVLFRHGVRELDIDPTGSICRRSLTNDDTMERVTFFLSEFKASFEHPGVVMFQHEGRNYTLGDQNGTWCIQHFDGTEMEMDCGELEFGTTVAELCDWVRSVVVGEEAALARRLAGYQAPPMSGPEPETTRLAARDSALFVSPTDGNIYFFGPGRELMAAPQGANGVAYLSEAAEVIVCPDTPDHQQGRAEMSADMMESIRSLLEGNA